MHTNMPFDTEKERKPLKVYGFSFSWRQLAYLAVALLVFIQLAKWLFNPRLPFSYNAISIFLCLLVFVPAIVLAFFSHPLSGLFLDRHFLYVVNHKKRECGVWRRF